MRVCQSRPVIFECGYGFGVIAYSERLLGFAGFGGGASGARAHGSLAFGA